MSGYGRTWNTFHQVFAPRVKHLDTTKQVIDNNSLSDDPDA